MGMRWDMGSTILDGMISGWILVLASVAALVVGMAVGLISAAGTEMGHIGFAVLGVLVFPVLMFSSLPRLIVGLWMLWIVLRYWTEDERRLERLYATMCLAAMMVWAAFGYEHWGPGVWIAAILLAGGYAAFRIWPDWHIQRLEEKVDQEIAQIRRQRLAEVRQGHGQAQEESDPSAPAATTASLLGADCPSDAPPPASPPRPTRSTGMDLLEMDERKHDRE